MGATCPAEGWPVGVTAHHTAASYRAIANLVRTIADGQGLPPITIDMFHQINAKHAREHPACSRAETLDMLRRDGAAAAAIVRGLDDASLDRTAASQLFGGGGDISARALAERILIGHITGHLDSMRAAVAA